MEAKEKTSRPLHLSLLFGFWYDKIDGDIVFGRLLDGEIARFPTLENFVNINARPPKQVNKVGTIGHQ